MSRGTWATSQSATRGGPDSPNASPPAIHRASRQLANRSIHQNKRCRFQADRSALPWREIENTKLASGQNVHRSQLQRNSRTHSKTLAADADRHANHAHAFPATERNIVSVTLFRAVERTLKLRICSDKKSGLTEVCILCLDDTSNW